MGLRLGWGRGQGEITYSSLSRKKPKNFRAVMGKGDPGSPDREVFKIFDDRGVFGLTPLHISGYN